MSRPDENKSFVLSGTDQCKEFLAHLPAWEVEEMSCAHTYYSFRLLEALFASVQRVPRPRGRGAVLGTPPGHRPAVHGPEPAPRLLAAVHLRPDDPRRRLSARRPRHSGRPARRRPTTRSRRGARGADARHAPSRTFSPRRSRHCACWGRDGNSQHGDPSTVPGQYEQGAGQQARRGWDPTGGSSGTTFRRRTRERTGTPSAASALRCCAPSATSSGTTTRA